MRFLAACGCFFVCTLSCFANDHEPIILKHQVTTFKNKDCKQSDTCSLLKAQSVVDDYKILVEDGYHYGTRARTSYETRALADIEDYIFVQFLRGCYFGSHTDQGSVVMDYSVQMKLFSQHETFYFPQWVIDSDNPDPAYSSLNNISSRFAILQWNTKKSSLEHGTMKFYFFEKPKFPRVYISDYPSTGFSYHDEAWNIAIELRTCLYRTRDVPLRLEPSDTDFAEPITCFSWKSSHVYNHQTHEYEQPQDVMAVCKAYPATE